MKIEEKDLQKLKHILKEIQESHPVYPESIKCFFDNNKHQEEFKRLSGIFIKLNICDSKKNNLGK